MSVLSDLPGTLRHMTAATVLTADQRHSALTELPDWRYWLGSLHTAYDCGSPAAAVALIGEIASASELRDHHPDVDWRYRHVFLRLTTYSRSGQVTARDVELAADISAAAAQLRAAAVPTLCRTVEVAVDAVDPAALAQPWASALGYTVDAQGNLKDPYRRNCSVWFQQTPTPDASRMHIDVQVEDSTADAVLEEAVTRGARRVDDRFRPSFTVLADAESNRLCICTDLGRD